jgi:recombination protein RecR
MSAFHNYPSRLLEQAVREFSALPGIGNKTALRLVLHLLKQDEEDVLNFGNSIIELKRNIHHCKICCNISDTETCQICSNPRRDSNLVCVVENIRDVMSIENTSQYNGLYHVLGGIISPIDGIGPSDLTVDRLESRVKEGGIDEVILALSTTMEGDTTNFYIYKRLKDLPVKVSALARGLAIGDELEYADEITLGRSIVDRTPFEATFGGKRQGNSI